jgi:uncharacterized membrane protein
MTWELTFRLRQYLKGSLWVLPLVGAVAGFVLGHLGLWLDHNVDVPSYWQYTASTATTVLAAIIGAVAALAGFVVTVTVLVVQMATSTFSARYMRLFYRDRLLKTLLAVLVGTITFSFSLLRQVEGDSVPDLGVTASGALVALSLLFFLLFLDRSIHRLRPVAVAALVAEAGRRAIEEAEQSTGPDGPRLVFERYDGPGQPALVVRSTRAGAIQAVDARGLVRFARAHGCVLVLRRPVGDFVPAGAALLDVFGGNAEPVPAERHLRSLIALGDERTIEQDPTFAVRVLADVAIKALSPAINDPTTATQVLDHLGDTLQLFGASPVYASAGPAGRFPESQVLVPGRRWEDVLRLGVTEIRRCGAESVQVTRRLRAMLEELHEAVPPERRAAVAEELGRLDATVAQAFGSDVDAELAAAADHQGIGGAWVA